MRLRLEKGPWFPQHHLATQMGHPKIHSNNVSLLDIPKECPKFGINSLQDKNQGNLKLWAHKPVFLVCPGYAEYSLFQEFRPYLTDTETTEHWFFFQQSNFPFPGK